MAVTPPLRFRVEDRSQVAQVRRAAEASAGALGFDDVRAGEAAIVATELSTNLLRHAGSGEVMLRSSPATGELDVIAWDRGPGIRDVARSMRDGFSTAGGSGTGLGAVSRLAASFDLQTTVGRGTAMVARLGGDGVPPVDGFALAMEGEALSGDDWGFVRQGSVVTILLADGLGHGDDAARASATAVHELRAGLAPEVLLQRMHAALRSTRGAAGAVARLDLATGALRFAGIGNIVATAVHGTTMKSLASMNGTLGSRVERINAYDYVLEPGALLVLHSDGCRGGWDLAAYPGALRRDPLIVASLILRDFERGRDDASVVVARVPGEDT